MFLWNIAVTSLAEVWIEMNQQHHERGSYPVTSLAEVWIEIDLVTCVIPLGASHFPCGSVD